MNRTRLAVAAALLLCSAVARATPSTVVWTPATTYVQPVLVPHLTYDTYFAEQGAYGIDTGLTVGVLPFEKVQGEIGVDLFYPGYTQNGLYLNAKVGVPEGALGAGFPGLSGGIYNVGFESDVTDYNIVHAELAKTFPVGTFAVGAYYGLNDALLVDENGEAAQAGFMASWAGPELKTDLPGLLKIVPAIDLMTGSSALGAVGTGLSLYFSPTVSLITGPVFFLNPDVQPGNASFMWTFQIDIDVPVL
jgi:hypothetical protein